MLPSAKDSDNRRTYRKRRGANSFRYARQLGQAGRVGVGLRNTRARLSQLYGSAHTFVLEPGSDGGAVATIRLPYRTRADQHAPTGDANDAPQSGGAAFAIAARA